MIVYADDDVVDNLETEMKNIFEAVDNIKKSIQISLDNTKTQNNKLKLQNPYIVKSVIKYMANGINQKDAIILTAMDFKTTTDRVDTIYWGQKRYMSAVNLFAKRYMCEKLKNANFKAKEIANILNISENHVFKLLKCKADFWFLEK